MITLSTIFTNHMVLQANKPIKIFGSGEGEAEIEFLGKVYPVCAFGGDWCITLDAMPYGGPYTLKFTQGGEQTLIEDVYVGEVFIAAGQSNMEMPLFCVDGGIEEAKSAENDMIRFFCVPRQFKKNTPRYGSPFRKKYEADTPWEKCTEQSALLTSAIGYKVAKELNERLGCAIGIIECNWGGRAIETFIDKKYFYNYDFLRPQIEDYNKRLSELDREKYEKEIEKHLAECKRVYDQMGDSLDIVRERGVQASVWYYNAEFPNVPSGAYDLDAPGTLYDSMVSKIVPYGTQGVLWYQGESNLTKNYANKYLVLMKCWREAFENEDLSFYACELAPFEYNGTDDELVTDENNWAFRREQQMLATKVGKNNYLVTTMHIGDMFDIHPRQKLELGRRMALKILKHSYGFDITGDQPTFKSAKFEKNKVTIELDNAKGLYNRFMWVFKIYVSDDSKILKRAEPEIKDDKIILHTEYENPTIVRFAFHSHYNGIAPFNEAGLPLAPFRTDGQEELFADACRDI